MSSAQPLVEVRDLSVVFPTDQGPVRAVEHVTCRVNRDEIVGLVGETGSGKSTLGRALLGYVRPIGRVTGGQVLFEGQDVTRMSSGKLRRWRGSKASIIVQNSRSALNPVETIGSQIWAVHKAHAQVLQDRSAVVEQALKEVRIPDPQRVARSYPHQLSGGMVQRVLIAMAIVNRPRLLIADEATTGLDATIQATVLDLLRDLVTSERMSSVVVTHDFGVVWHYCSRVMVMRGGVIVEEGPTRQVFENPQHPYTVQLVRASALGSRSA